MLLAFYMLLAVAIQIICFPVLVVFLWLGARLARIPGVGFRRHWWERSG